MYRDYYEGDDLKGSSHEHPCKDCWEGAQDCLCIREDKGQEPTITFAHTRFLLEEERERAGRRKFLADKMGYQPDDPGWN